MKKLISIIIITNCLLSENTEYLIYTTSDFIDSANDISELHQNDVEISMQLNTHIIIEDTLSMPINEYIDDLLDTNNNLKYLLIIGDENIIDPIYYANSVPCDDYYSSEFINPFTLPNPRLVTGRILTDNPDEAIEIIQRIRNYSLSTPNGLWKNKLLLTCDNEFKNGSEVRQEKYHTIYSDKIYNELKNIMPINTMYGSDYNVQESSDWFTQPELTEDLINTINSGVGFINYIGHGTHEILADEDILKLDRDLNLINCGEKLPVWVVGTCSFGNYDNNICFAEELMKHDNAAIAVISTTRGILSTENYKYLKNFFNTQIKNYINSNNDNSRIGDIFYNAKSSTLYSYRFHLFGDPALPLKIGKYNNQLISNSIDTIYIGSLNTIETNSPNSTLNIFDEESEIYKYYNYTTSQDDSCSQGISCLDTLVYKKNGTKLFEGEFNNFINYYIPLDINTSNKVKAMIHIDDINFPLIQDIPNIDLSLNVDTSIFNDNIGPEISAFHKNVNLEQINSIFPPYNFLIKLKDNLPINLSGLNYHNIRLWIDNNNNSYVLNDYYVSESDTSGYINVNLQDSLFLYDSHQMFIEAWDILNNHSIKKYDLHILDTPNYDVYNVYNIPNPFNEKTFFTFNLKEPKSIEVIIEVYSKSGKILKTFHEFYDESQIFISIPSNGWDGRNNKQEFLSNGTYFYNLRVLSQDSKQLYNQIHKITILK